MVYEAKVYDLKDMMDRVGIYEMNSEGDFYTWSNKQVDNVIYYRIDRVIGNIDWLQNNVDTTLTIISPSIPDPSMLVLKGKEQSTNQRHYFKYINCLAKLNGFNYVVAKS